MAKMGREILSNEDQLFGCFHPGTPTTYAGVKFRSRIEATWAAFFDLADIGWEHEPIFLKGWLPDFRLNVGGFTMLAEVKKYDLNGLIESGNLDSLLGIYPEYNKADAHCTKHQVILLGSSPIYSRGMMGVPCTQPSNASQSAEDLCKLLSAPAHELLARWRTAEATTKWKER